MPIKNILVPLRGCGDETHVVLSGLSLAQRLNAHVTATADVGDMQAYIEPMSMSLAATYYAEMQNLFQKERDERYQRARTAFAEAIAVTKVPTVDRPTCRQASAYWRDASGDADSAVSAFGRLADLIVVDRPGLDSGLAVQGVEDALFTIRRPVLVVPNGTQRVGQHIAIAWNGSPEAANAARSALDLMDPGGKVTIIQVGDLASGGTPASELVDYLGWHCFEADVRLIEDKPKSTARLLLNAARGAGADILAIGAYSHSHFRELFFGGVTSYMLRETDMPVLLSH